MSSCSWKKHGGWRESTDSVVIPEQETNMFPIEGRKYCLRGLMQLWSVKTDRGSTREPSIENFQNSMQPWSLDSELRGTREPSNGGQSQCDPGLERERESLRGTMRFPRLYWIFGNKDLEDIGGSLPLYSSPAVWF